MIDIREYYEDDAGERKPGKKGKLHRLSIPSVYSQYITTNSVLTIRPPFGGNLNWKFLKVVHITEDHIRQN